MYNKVGQFASTLFFCELFAVFTVQIHIFAATEKIF